MKYPGKHIIFLRSTFIHYLQIDNENVYTTYFSVQNSQRDMRCMNPPKPIYVNISYLARLYGKLSTPVSPVLRIVNDTLMKELEG